MSERRPALRLEATFLILLLLFVSAACGRKAPVSPPVVQRPSPAPGPAPTAPAGIPAPKTPPPAPVRTAAPGPPPPETESLDSGPPIRIGLATGLSEARIDALGEFFLVEKSPEAPRRTLKGEYLVRVEGASSDTREIYRLQVASLTSAESAERLRRQLAERLSIPAITRQNPAAGTTQVRVGEFSTRDLAQHFARSTLEPAGYSDAIVVKEDSYPGTEPKMSLRGPDNFFRVSSAGFFFMPATRSQWLRLDGKPYRGIFDLILNRNGRITVVNQLGVEEYLLGVVPAEISPSTYPEPAALSAQAIAARTYALRNMGRFNAEGFDLTADIRSQVYGGVPQERELTNDAVRSTRGLAIYYEGNLINAMYSSTCGGRTEEYSNVFDAPPVPYLSSVFCTAESNPNSVVEMTLEGRHDFGEPIFADDGSLANRHLELARVLGLTGERSLSSAYLAASPSEEEVQAWLLRARSLARIDAVKEPKATRFHTTRAGFLSYAAESFYGAQEISRRISPTDTTYYLGNLRDGGSVPAQAAPALAFLMQKGLWRPYPDNSARPLDPIGRADALTLLTRWIELVRTDILKSGTFLGAASRTTSEDSRPPGISVKQGTRTLQLPLAQHPRLFRVADGRSLPVDSLRVIGSEKIRYHLAPDGTINFLEVELNPAGAASDRYSPQSVWQTTLSRQTVSEKIRPLAPELGELSDLTSARQGSSGRAVQIRVTGLRGSTVLNGYRVRNALGLRDTLFTVSRTYGPDGKVESFVFSGRGWGHGVGLCQVGAFGMARAGLSTEEILKTYYRGVEIKKAY